MTVDSKPHETIISEEPQIPRRKGWRLWLQRHWLPGLVIVLLEAVAAYAIARWAMPAVRGPEGIVPFALILVGLLLLTVGSVRAYGPGWSQWTGFGSYKSDPKQDRDLQRAKTLWDWLQLLIIPVVLAGGALWFNAQQDAISTRNTAQQSRISRELAARQQNNDALKDYLDGMSALMITQNVPNLRTSMPGDAIRDLARARTLTVLHQISTVDPSYGFRMRDVVTFLSEAGLITGGTEEAPSTTGIVALDGAELSGAILIMADLHGVRLHWAFLIRSTLVAADLGGADLSWAYLEEADLRDADLRGADLRGAHLERADLRSADLSYSDLTGAIVTNDQLKAAKSLHGATLPNGTIHA